MQKLLATAAPALQNGQNFASRQRPTGGSADDSTDHSNRRETSASGDHSSESATVEKNVDYTQPRNLILTSVVLVSGVSGATLRLGTVELRGMAFGTLVAVAISLFLALLDHLGWTAAEGAHGSDAE